MVNDDGIILTSCELDTHADTCCFGKHCYILNQNSQNVAEVTPFLAKLGKLNKVPIVTAVVAYDCPDTYQTYILYFHESLYIAELENNLLCRNQLRSNGVIVNDVPLQFVPKPQRTTSSHTITIEDLRIPLHLRGVISYFNARKP